MFCVCRSVVPGAANDNNSNTRPRTRTHFGTFRTHLAVSDTCTTKACQVCEQESEGERERERSSHIHKHLRLLATKGEKERRREGEREEMCVVFGDTTVRTDTHAHAQ